MAWRVARSIPALQRQLKAECPRAVPPATDVNSWGTIGDLLHDKTSDHVPHDYPGWGTQIVTAGDFPHAPSLGMDGTSITEAMRKARDVRVKYIIFNHRVTGPNHTDGKGNWIWAVYNGSDPHTDHFHLSVVGDSRADGEQPWATREVVNVALAGDERNWLASDLRATASVVALNDTWVEAGSEATKPNNLAKAIKTIQGDVEALMSRPAAVVDAESIATLLTSNPVFIHAIAVAVVDEIHNRTAE